jgi:taurine dioxygenase
MGVEMLSVQRLPGVFGVEISGIDLSQPMDEETEREFLDLFHRHQLIVVKNQSLEFEELDRLTRYFGRQDPHFLDHLRMRGHPAILMLSNVFENDKPIGVYEGAAFWHTDVAYRDPPNSATIVYSLECPRGGCPTHFADMFSAYDALPASMKARIDDRVALHHYGNRADMDENSRTSAERLTPEQKKRVTNVFHPLVQRHPVTGRKSLYGVAGSSFGIVGMPDDEALELLDELKAHATEPRFVTQYDYGVGDVAAWDTYSTLHRATLQDRATTKETRRLLWRVSVTGRAPTYERKAT